MLKKPIQRPRRKLSACCTRPREVVEQSITNLLSPASAADALETYWLDQLLGKPDEGKVAIKKVIDLDIPMPIES